MKKKIKKKIKTAVFLQKGKVIYILKDKIYEVKDGILEMNSRNIKKILDIEGLENLTQLKILH